MTATAIVILRCERPGCGFTQTPNDEMERLWSGEGGGWMKLAYSQRDDPDGEREAARLRNVGCPPHQMFCGWVGVDLCRTCALEIKTWWAAKG
jgi:hypothetical protein